MNRGFSTARKYWYLMMLILLGVSLAACGGGGGGASGAPPIVTVPTAPTGLQATAASTTSINVTWTDASSNEDGFKVYRGATSTTATTLVATVGPGIASYPDAGLAASTTYYYRVTAYNSAGESDSPGVANATTNAVTAPSAPTTLQANAVSSAVIQLAWTDASSDELGFRVYRGATSTTVTTLLATLGAGVTSYPDAGLAASTTYYYAVKAFNVAGESNPSNVANATTSAPPLAPPTAPTNLVGTAASGTVVNLAWTDTSSDEDGFRVYRGTGASPASFTQIGGDLGVNVQAFADITVTGGTTYVYRVLAFNTAGDSSPAQSAAVVTPLGPNAVDGGNRHSLALMSDGTVRAWGSNTEGQLGIGSDIDNSLVPVAIPGLSSVSAISAGDGHSLALMTDGTVKGWGQNFFGEVGSGDNTNKYSPVSVQGGAFTNVVQVSAGGFYSIALKDDGSVWAWGSGEYGQMGDGTINIPKTVPGLVNGLGSGVQAIVASQDHSLALKTNGEVWAWGRNDRGDLGDGTILERLVPVQVSGLTGVVAVSAGETHSLALMSDNTVRAWGGNSFGELGDGSTTDRPNFVTVVGLTNVKAIAAGGNFSLALKNDGTVWAWGSGVAGRIGNGATTNQLVPVQVSALTNVRTISAGQGHSLARRGDANPVWAWGYNGFGQIGDNTRTDRPTPVPTSGF